MTDDARVVGMHDRTLTLVDVRQPSRTATDYAVEHARYLVDAARAFMDASEAVERERAAHDEAEPGDAAAAASDELDAAEERRGGAWANLRNAIYEFEKRRDRALAVEPSNVLRPQIDVMRDALQWIVDQGGHFFTECLLAEEIMERCRAALAYREPHLSEPPPKLCGAVKVGNFGLVCRLPKGHEGDHRCAFDYRFK